MQKVEQVVHDLASKASTGSTKLPTAKLGKNGPQVTRLGYGAMGLSAFYGAKKSDEKRLAILDKLYADGELFWDSADMYGDNEDLLGKWFKLNPGKREHIFLATKFANSMGPDGKFVVNTSPEYCLKACEKSLKRLGVDHIDLYYAHRLDGKTPIEKTVQAMQQLKREGKIKYLGLSECSAESLRRACKIEHIDAVQIEYSPFSLDIESPEIDLLKTCRALGVAVVAYSPIGRGMLSGTLRSHDDLDDDDYRKQSPRYSKENFPKNLKLVDAIKSIAEKKGVTATQLTLAWILAQGDDFFPIPGTTNLQRVEENLGALSIKLTADEEKEIRKVCEDTAVSGERYLPAHKSLLFADTPALES